MDPGRRAELQSWMSALADGDRSAFDPMFVALQPLLAGFAAKTLTPQDADDVAQRALVAVFSRAAEFDRSRDALSWILGIASWEVRTARRWIGRRREESGDVAASTAGLAFAAVADGQPTPEEHVLAADLERAALDVLGLLSPEDVLTLRAAAAGERPPGIAAATFRKRLQRALSRWRSAWKETADD